MDVSRVGLPGEYVVERKFIGKGGRPEVEHVQDWREPRVVPDMVIIREGVHFRIFDLKEAEDAEVVDLASCRDSGSM